MLEGFSLGADDYVCKPFSFDILMARIEAVLRRATNKDNELITVGNTSLNTLKYEIICDDKSVALSSKEYQILEVLMQNANSIITKERIMERIWGFDSEVEHNAAEVYISFLRKKLASIDSLLAIKVTRGVGYQLIENE